MSVVSLLLALAAAPPAQRGKPTLEEMIERVRKESDLVPDDLLHQIAVWQNETAFDALGEFYGLMSTAAKRRQVVHEYRHFAKTPLASRGIDHLREVGLSPKDPDEGKEAVGALAAFEEAGADALRAIARGGGDLLVRAEAIGRLVPHRQEGDLPLLLELARSDPAAPALRAAAIRAIGPDPRGEEATRRALGDPSPTVRGAALEARAKRRDPAAIALAREWAADPKVKEWSPCMGAIAVLREAKGGEDAALLFAIGSRAAAGLRAAARKALQDFDGAQVVAAAAAALGGKDRSAALFAVGVLEGLKHPEAGRSLRRLLQSSDVVVMAAAADALGARGEIEAAPDLRKETSVSDPAARAAVVGALSDLLPEDEDWKKRLRQFAEDRDREVRVAAALALGGNGGVEALPVLERMLFDREASVRAAAIEGLARGRLKAAVPILLARLRKEQGRLREDFAAALRRITGQAFGREPADWERWWVAEGERFAVPPLREVEAKAKALAEARAQARTASFYGIEFLSDRAAFVLDASGSMAERTGTAAPGGRAESRYEVALRELRNALDGRRGEPGARFDLFLFAGNADAWHERLQPLDERSVELAVGFASKRTPSGGTNIHEALSRAFEDPDVDTIYLLSDGEPSAGLVTDPALLRAEVRGWNRFRRVVIHTVSIGTSSALLEGLAADSGGRFVKR
ncbi:MAG TPA: HEAT repeat domain-containing protein [Planctomycetota bacterium]|jgi:HEAT repeat protein|nr:HEAT repeat domain-containing protein [Planctomycetota bacterium]